MTTNLTLAHRRGRLGTHALNISRLYQTGQKFHPRIGVERKLRQFGSFQSNTDKLLERAPHTIGRSGDFKNDGYFSRDRISVTVGVMDSRACGTRSFRKNGQFIHCFECDMLAEQRPNEGHIHSHAGTNSLKFGCEKHGMNGHEWEHYPFKASSSGHNWSSQIFGSKSAFSTRSQGISNQLRSRPAGRRNSLLGRASQRREFSIKRDSPAASKPRFSETEERGSSSSRNRRSDQLNAREPMYKRSSISSLKRGSSKTTRELTDRRSPPLRTTSSPSNSRPWFSEATNKSSPFSKSSRDSPNNARPRYEEASNKTLPVSKSTRDGSSPSQTRSAESHDKRGPLTIYRHGGDSSSSRPRTGQSTNRGYPLSIPSQNLVVSSPRFSHLEDKRIPLSVPYTTPASEFLYGTFVVEAALSSQRDSRRKLYKLYIYTGDNREDVDRDLRMERLARKNRVEVNRVGNDWLRVMDKMSAGRPHNGYILEASPLPRLPVSQLGQVISAEGKNGFRVTVDYQSREEAAVNGTSDFINIPKDAYGRKPLVLLLDSIKDPGNLGGIIRTASFLGVSAIAISTRNSASFTPVVLKASAGASENITLLAVKNPVGFVADSKSAGWKIYAAVAPSKKNDPAMPASISTHDLDDPLSQNPCILMLGSEGDGLRWNLRSKADVDLYIQGCGQAHNVDSLNVSVAAGVLCDSFLRTRISAGTTDNMADPEPLAVAPETPVKAGSMF